MIDLVTVRRLTAAALENIERHRRRINALNVYPVPDGDTGTNLEKTMQGIVAELDRSTASTTAQLAADVQRAATMEAKGNSGPSAATSIMKNAGTWLTQERHELTLEIMGHQGLGWEGDTFEKGELEIVRAWLYGKAFTIFGGSQEVQSNIVSKRILGLPDLTQAK